MDTAAQDATYPALLRASTELPRALRAVAFTMLTALISPPEVFHPGTCVEQGWLVVPGSRARRIPLARCTSQVLGRDEGPLRSLLGIDHCRGFGFWDLEQIRDTAGPFSEIELEQLPATALHHLVERACTWKRRRALLAYAALPVDRRLSAPTDPDLASTAALIDETVAAAGLVLAPDPNR